MGSYDPQPGNSERQDVGGAIASQIGPLADQIKGKVSNVADRASGALSDAKDRRSEAADNAGEVMGALRDAVIRFPADHFGLAILGHQWKPALPLMASRSLTRAAHLFPMMSSSSSIVATCLLTMGSSTSAHSVSAGCSSGV